MLKCAPGAPYRLQPAQLTPAAVWLRARLLQGKCSGALGPLHQWRPSLAVMGPAPLWQPAGPTWERVCRASSPHLIGVGAIDFAGSGAVHCVGGYAAAAGCAIIGPRIGRFLPDGTVRHHQCDRCLTMHARCLATQPQPPCLGRPASLPCPSAHLAACCLVPALSQLCAQVVDMPGHNSSLFVLGVMILWFGWYGFNPGSQLALVGYSSAIANAAVTTTIAPAAAGLSAIMVKAIIGKVTIGAPAHRLTCSVAQAPAATRPCRCHALASCSSPVQQRHLVAA